MVEIYSSNSGGRLVTGFSPKIKYGITVGRRQPMHIVHLDCIREIVRAGLHPIIIMGSVNAANSAFYKPLENPLTKMQQIEQLQIAMAKASIKDYTLLSLDDVDDIESWSDNLASTLVRARIVLDETVFHYREKVVDTKKLTERILPLSKYEAYIMNHNISIWRSVNSDKQLDEISSTPFRIMDLEGAEFYREKINLVCPDFITLLARTARTHNPHKLLMSHLPLTTLDLVLGRLMSEKQVDVIGDWRELERVTIKGLSKLISSLF